VMDSPFGVGYNNWDLGAKQYAEAGGLRSEWFFFVHNKYFLELGELGWLGVILFVTFLSSIIWRAFRALRYQDSVLSPLLLGLTVAMIGQCLHMLADVFNDRVQIMLLWVAAAMILVIIRILKESDITSSRQPGLAGDFLRVSDPVQL
jgi:O-antigen ligase